MAYDPSYDTDDSAVPHAVRVFFKKRLYEVVGLAVFLFFVRFLNVGLPAGWLKPVLGTAGI